MEIKAFLDQQDRELLKLNESDLPQADLLEVDAELAFVLLPDATHQLSSLVARRNDIRTPIGPSRDALNRTEHDIDRLQKVIRGLYVVADVAQNPI